jgi:hypothetical protein
MSLATECDKWPTKGSEFSVEHTSESILSQQIVLNFHRRSNTSRPMEIARARGAFWPLREGQHK